MHNSKMFVGLTVYQILMGYFTQRSAYINQFPINILHNKSFEAPFGGA